MIITLIGFGLLILGIIGLVIDRWVELFAVTFQIGLITSIICVTLIAATNFKAPTDIHKAKMEYERILKQLEYDNSDYEDVSKIKVIQYVYDWNTNVYTAYHWANNPWTSWFWNKEYVDSLKYIDLKE